MNETFLHGKLFLPQEISTTNSDRYWLKVRTTEPKSRANNMHTTEIMHRSDMLGLDDCPAHTHPHTPTHTSLWETMQTAWQHYKRRWHRGSILLQERVWGRSITLTGDYAHMPWIPSTLVFSHAGGEAATFPRHDSGVESPAAGGLSLHLASSTGPRSCGRF